MSVNFHYGKDGKKNFPPSWQTQMPTLLSIKHVEFSYTPSNISNFETHILSRCNFSQSCIRKDFSFLKLETGSRTSAKDLHPCMHKSSNDSNLPWTFTRLWHRRRSSCVSFFKFDKLGNLSSRGSSPNFNIIKFSCSLGLFTRLWRIFLLSLVFFFLHNFNLNKNQYQLFRNFLN